VTAVILQARLDSSRLPGKSLLPLCGQPLVFRVMQALYPVRADERILACPQDCAEAFAPLAARAGFSLVTGSKHNVLSRYCKAVAFALNKHPGEMPETLLVIRATGDNPFVFADAAGSLAEEALAQKADYAAYGELPYGAGVEAVSAAALLRAEAEAREPEEREHVCPYLYNNPGLFKLHRPAAPSPLRRPEIRLTVDTAEDFARAEKLYAALSNAHGESVERYYGKNIIAAALTEAV
jgi:spore coat polysaccharide biosynthesis protein SpsF